MNATQSGRFFVGPAYSVCLLLAQDRSLSLNVSGHHGKCHVTLESHNAVIAAQIQSMRLTTSISRVAHRWPRRCGRNSHPGRECFRENTRWRSLFSPAGYKLKKQLMNGAPRSITPWRLDCNRVSLTPTSISTCLPSSSFSPAPSPPDMEPHVRSTAAEPPVRFSAGALMRNGIMKGLAMLSRRRVVARRLVVNAASAATIPHQ